MVSSAHSREQWYEVSDPAGDVQAWANETDLRHGLHSNILSMSEEELEESDFGSAQDDTPITPPRVFDIGLSRTLDGRSAASLRGRALEMRRPLLTPFTLKNESDAEPSAVEDWTSEDTGFRRDSPQYDEKHETPETVVPSTPNLTVTRYIPKSSTDSLLSSVKDALKRVKPALPLFVVLLLISCLIVTISYTSFITGPLCSLKFLQTTSFCKTQTAFPSIDGDVTYREPNFPAMMKIQDRAFTTLLKSASALEVLAPEIRESRLATNDLAIHVRLSDLGAKLRLAKLLEDFSAEAKETARGMNRFYSQLRTAVDNVSTAGDHAMRTLEQVEKSGSNYLPAMFRSRASEDVLSSSFERSCTALATNLKRLINTAESLLGQLESLRLRLDTILEVVALERKDIALDREKVLASLWTALGKSAEQFSQFETNLQLLLQVEAFRSAALLHVMDALETLAQFSDELEELSKRVATPELAGEKIPLHVQLESIRKGVERLDHSREVPTISAGDARGEVVRHRVSM